MVGKIIDDVTLAGGDLTRFQGANFSIEDSKPLEEQPRAAAVSDMVAKANQMVNLSGVQLGKPYYISETGGSSPLRVAYAESAVFDRGALPRPYIPKRLTSQLESRPYTPFSKILAQEQCPGQQQYYPSPLGRTSFDWFRTIGPHLLMVRQARHERISRLGFCTSIRLQRPQAAATISPSGSSYSPAKGTHLNYAPNAACHSLGRERSGHHQP